MVAGFGLSPCTGIESSFDLLMDLKNGVLWYMGPYGSLADTVESI
jgi:hypothetical protein